MVIKMDCEMSRENGDTEHDWIENADFFAALQESFLFAGKSGDDIYRLMWNERCNRFAKGAVIYSPTSFSRALGIVLSGSVDVMRCEDGRRVVLNRIPAGGSFGAAALYGDEDETYATTVVACGECVVLFINGDRLGRIMKADFTLAENYIRFLSGRIRFLNRRVAGFTAGAADRRLARYLLEHSSGDGTVPLPKSMTALSNALGVGRSSLYRSLDMLCGAGIIERRGKEIVVSDVDGLFQLV